MGNLRTQEGNVIVEAALVLPLILVLLFVSVEFLLAARASYDLNTIARIGVETAEWGPRFLTNPPSDVNMTTSSGNPPDPDSFDSCLNDLFAKPPPLRNCGHIVTHIKMHRAYLQLNNSSLTNPLYTTSNNFGSVTITVAADYVPVFLSIIRALGSFKLFNSLNFGEGIRLNAVGTAQSYFDT